MKFLLDHLYGQGAYGMSTLQRAFACRCSRAVFFGNSRCLSCQTSLGYEPELGQVFALEAGSEPNTFELAHRSSRIYKLCGNARTPAMCNWLVAVDDPNPFCKACRLNGVIPNLTVPGNGTLWSRLEDAKRRVIAALIALGLPLEGLSFQFLTTPPGGPRVMTGHKDGVITINLDEADPVKREQARASMREPYRTLVGHFRHEVGHFFWDRLVRNTECKSEFRALFGNEELDYAAALKANYERGPRPDWQQFFISAYASVHPWEDWAETWAHYLHMIDTLGTALSFGVKPDQIAMPFDPFGTDALYRRDGADAERFLSFLNSWIKLTAVMNELCRSMGQPDFYPFALPKAVVAKLHFIHMLVCEYSACQSRQFEAA